MKYLFLILVSFFIVSCTAQDKAIESNESVTEVSIPYGESIPFLLGIHIEHENKDALKIEFIDNSGTSFLIHQGDFEGWGMRWTDKEVKTGEYVLRLTWDEEKEIKKTERNITIKQDTKYFSLNIELANDSMRGRFQNGIYLDQYTESLEGVEFTRNWNPSEQYKSDSLLLPDYEVVNNNDSTLYGAYTRFSSSLSINWVQAHTIAFMGFEVETDSGWVNMPCNAPRIEMDLKHGEKGQTLKDMVLGCETKNFDVDKTYKITINYMLNNRVFEKNEKHEDIEDNVYVEQTIYSFEDEFKIESR